MFGFYAANTPEHGNVDGGGRGHSEHAVRGAHLRIVQHVIAAHDAAVRGETLAVGGCECVCVTDVRVRGQVESVAEKRNTDIGVTDNQFGEESECESRATGRQMQTNIACSRAWRRPRRACVDSRPRRASWRTQCCDHRQCHRRVHLGRRRDGWALRRDRSATHRDEAPRQSRRGTARTVEPRTTRR